MMTQPQLLNFNSNSSAHEKVSVEKIEKKTVKKKTVEKLYSSLQTSLKFVKTTLQETLDAPQENRKKHVVRHDRFQLCALPRPA